MFNMINTYYLCIRFEEEILKTKENLLKDERKRAGKKK